MTTRIPDDPLMRMDHDQNTTVLPDRPIGEVDEITDEHIINNEEDFSLDLKDLLEIHPPVDLSDQVTISYNKPMTGGFADVFIGEMEGKKVAVKVVRIPSNAKRANWQKTFARRSKRERYIWAAVTHPNISEFLGYANDLGRDPVSPAMISLWYEHGTSRDYLDAQDRPVNVRLRLTQDVLDGLFYLHQLGLVHGDMKPTNILVDDNGVARLCDFGLVRLEDWAGHFGMTTSTGYGGTERYKAPELFSSKENRGVIVSTREGDIYALGSVMLEFIERGYPYKQFKNETVKEAVLEGYSPAPRSDTIYALSDLTDQFWDLLEACWGNAAERPSIGEVVEWFTKILPPTQAPAL